MTDVVLTGERTWPGIPRENYWFMRHLACYRWAANSLRTSTAGHTHLGGVLDAGSGEGYGSAELAAVAPTFVVGLELDEPTLRHARVRYPALALTQANLVALPFRSKAFAASVSLQVIEHIWDPGSYLRELARCTSGPIVISTPNRLTHSPGLGRGERPDNPFHVREFDATELTELLMEAIPARTPSILGLSHGPRLHRWELRNGSLPGRLLDATVSARTWDFASSVTVDDFQIETLEHSGAEERVHDLVALL